MEINDNCISFLPINAYRSVAIIVVSLISIFYKPYLFIRANASRNDIFRRIYVIRAVLCLVSFVIDMVRITELSLQSSVPKECRTLQGLALLGVILTWVLTFVTSCLEVKKGVIQSSVLPIIFLTFVATEFHPSRVLFIPVGYSESPPGGYSPADLAFLISVVFNSCFTVMVDLCLPSRWFKLKANKNGGETPIQNVNPSIGASTFIRLSFVWMLPQMLLARKRTLQVDDLYGYSFKDSCRGTHSRLKQYLQRHSGGPAPSDSYRQNRRKFLIGVLNIVALPLLPSFIASAISCFLNVTIIINLRSLIQYVDYGTEDTTQGVYLCVGLLLQGLLFSVCTVPWYYTSHYAATRVKSLASAIILEKFLALSPLSRTKSEKVVLSLLTLDAHKISLIFSECNVLHLPIFYCPLATVVIWQALGVSGLVGISFIILIIYINSVYLRRIIQRIKTEEIKIKTKRVGLLTSILNGIKVIKSYAWEDPFIDRVTSMRKKELQLLKKASMVKIFASALSSFSPFLITSGMILLHYWLSPESPITADKIFIVLAVVSRFRFYLGYLPTVSAILSQGIVSLKRCFEFIELDEEKTILTDSHKWMDVQKKQEEACVEIVDGSFSWKEENSFLTRVNLGIKRGELAAIIGRVGEGKSTILSAILGEVNYSVGDIKCHGRIGYIPQEAWLQNSTIRANILFGHQLDSSRYQAVLEACALRQDIKNLPAGDKTQVGDMGVTLSGGQKQRISLARAVYDNADLYLLDDPLSAVDTHVARTLFDQVIGNKGILADKSRILVTNALDYLPFVDRIFVIEKGELKECSSDYILNTKEDHFQLTHRDETGSVKCSLTSSQNNMIPDEKVADKDDLDITRKASWRTTWYYIKKFSFKLLLILHLGVASMVVCMVWINIWVSAWSDDWKVDKVSASKNTLHRLAIFSGLGLAKGVGVIFTQAIILKGTLSAAKSLHQDLIIRVFTAKPSFFDTTKFGSIINWFTRDFDDIDENVPTHLWTTLDQLTDVLVLIVMVYWISPWLLLGSIPVILLLVISQRLYSVYARDAMRLEGVSRAPVFSYFREALQGVVYIRSSGKQRRFCDNFYPLLDRSAAPFWHIAASKGFMMISTMVLATLVNFAICLTGVLFRKELNPSFVAATMYVAFTFLLVNHKLIQAIAEVERSLISVERVSCFNRIPYEPIGANTQRKFEPKSASLQFINYSARYQSDLPHVLKNINLMIDSGTKVGIIGRTGAGKSSLIYALLRMLQTSSGEIRIDGRDIATIDLPVLRSLITVVSQDPRMFQVSLRDNLDPGGHLSDREIWEALEQAHLKDHILSLNDGINSNCDNPNEIFSVGQRQLFCLARAFIRKSKMIILDEPTASVDDSTDRLVQNMLRHEFNGCTLLTIAHRIKTVIDYDSIVVVDQGQIVEYDSPGELMHNPSSYLYKLISEDQV